MCIFRWSGKAPQSMVDCDKSNFSFVYVVSEATRSGLRGCQFQNFPGGAYPQTRYVWVHYHMLEFPPSVKNPVLIPD